MSYLWIRGDAEHDFAVSTSVWHIIEGEPHAAEKQFARVLCNEEFLWTSYVPGTESGWDYMKRTLGRLCPKCVEALMT